MKKINRLFLLVLLTGIATSAAWAQVDIKQVDTNSNTASNSITEEELLTRISDVAGIDNLLQLATEANHVANINVRGDDNTTNITQFGSGNIGAISIDGYNRNTVDLNQNGTNLLSLITVEGSSNELSMDQSGENLGNLVQVVGKGLNIDLEQDNNGFRYYQDGVTSNSIGITSSSSYVPIIIRNN